MVFFYSLISSWLFFLFQHFFCVFEQMHAQCFKVRLKQITWYSEKSLEQCILIQFGLNDWFCCFPFRGILLFFKKVHECGCNCGKWQHPLTHCCHVHDVKVMFYSHSHSHWRITSDHYNVCSILLLSFFSSCFSCISMLVTWF